jgi:hypothetical protein
MLNTSSVMSELNGGKLGYMGGFSYFSNVAEWYPMSTEA